MVAATALPVRPSAPAGSAPSSRPDGLPGLAERQRIVLDLVGQEALDARFLTFRRILVDEVDRLFARHVLPVVRPVWPEVDRAAFLPKWRGGFELYCSLALSCMVCSARRPRFISALSRILRVLRATEDTVVAVGLRTIPLLFRVLERRAARRAALVSAWILVLDEVLDDGMNDIPLASRADVLARVLRGEPPGGDASPAVRAAHALGEAIRSCVVDEADRAWLDEVIAEGEAWARGEIANLLGVPDPAGMCHRAVGITASMDLLGWAVARYADDDEHSFLYRVAELGQMVDDWLDLDKDRAQGRRTPCTTGAWSPATMAESYAAAEALLHRLADTGGEPAGPYRNVVVRTFRGQIQHMARCLVDNP